MLLGRIGMFYFNCLIQKEWPGQGADLQALRVRQGHRWGVRGPGRPQGAGGCDRRHPGRLAETVGGC